MLKVYLAPLEVNAVANGIFIAGDLPEKSSQAFDTDTMTIVLAVLGVLLAIITPFVIYAGCRYYGRTSSNR